MGRKKIYKTEEERIAHIKAYQREYQKKYKETHRETLRKLSKIRREKDPVRTVWERMMNRCGLRGIPEPKKLGNYVLRGIYVCKEWHEYKNFKKWALENGWARGLEIDRTNNDEGYNPSNCRFITRRENSWNRRCSVMVEWNGSMIPLAKLFATESHPKELTYSSLYGRFRMGWDIKRALATP